MPARETIFPNEKAVIPRMATVDELAFTEIFFHYIPFLHSHVRIPARHPPTVHCRHIDEVVYKGVLVSII